MTPRREQLLQLARLLGGDAYAERFGSPRTADPGADALRALVEERLEHLAQGLVEEAAASDDVIDVASATGYLEDRLRTLSGVLTDGQAGRSRTLFQEGTRQW